MLYIYIEGKYMKNSVIAIPSQYIVITTIVYALLCPVFFEFDNALGEGENFVVNNNDKTMMYSQQAIEEEEVETECKSPCPSSAEMCIEMCA
jgi:hypothetical protein